jgi:hypothetical protein
MKTPKLLALMAIGCALVEHAAVQQTVTPVKKKIL